jgi:iron-sulfur cluster assembly protein
MAINLTNAAAERINELKRKRQTPEHFLRLGVRGGGCSGLSYVLDFVETPEPKDKIFDLNGVKVVVDRKSYLFVNGTEIDYKKGLMKTGFEFKNPIASGSCSCGESFSV